MKKIILLLLFIYSSQAYSQNITGTITYTPQPAEIHSNVTIEAQNIRVSAYSNLTGFFYLKNSQNGQIANLGNVGFSGGNNWSSSLTFLLHCEFSVYNILGIAITTGFNPHTDMWEPIGLTLEVPFTRVFPNTELPINLNITQNPNNVVSPNGNAMLTFTAEGANDQNTEHEFFWYVNNNLVQNAESNTFQYNANVNDVIKLRLKKIYDNFIQGNVCFQLSEDYTTTPNIVTELNPPTITGFTYNCTGQNVLVEAERFDNIGEIQWSTTANFSNIIETGITNNGENLIYPFNNTNVILYARTVLYNGISSTVNTSVALFGTPTNLTVLNNQNQYCIDEEVLIQPTAVNGNTYQWFLNAAGTVSINPNLINENGFLDFTALNAGSYSYHVRATSLSGCKTQTIPVNFVINPKPTNYEISNNNADVCKGQNISFVAGANGTNIQYRFWQNAAGNQPLTQGVSGNTYTVNTTNLAPGNYTFWANAISSGCATELTQVNYTVLEQPSNLSVIGNLGSYCNGESILITPTATGGFSYQWFLNAAATLPINPNLINENGALEFVATIIGSYNYYVRATSSGGCTTQTISVNFNINSGPTNYEISNNNAEICKGQNISFVAGADVNSIQSETNSANIQYRFWQNAAGNQPITQGVSGNTYTVNTTNLAPGNHTFWANAISNGCATELTQVNYTVLEQPTNLVTTGNLGTYCTGQPILITPSAQNATGYQWAYDINFNEILDNTFVDAQGRLNFTPTTPVNNQVIYVRALNNNGCFSTPIALIYTVRQGVTNLAITNNGAIVCELQPITFVAGAQNANSYRFYQDSELLIPLTQGVSGNTYIPNTSNIGNYTFYVVALNSNGCQSLSLQVNYEIVSRPNNLQALGNTNICVGQQVLITPSAQNANALQWAYDPNFNSFVEAEKIDQQGRLNYIENTQGTTTYYLRAINQNNCTSTTMSVIIVANPNPTNINVTNNDTEICKGEIIVFEASAVSGNGFEYYKDSELTIPVEEQYINGINNFRLSLPTSGYTQGQHNLYLIARNNNGCTSETFTITFLVNDIPGATSITGSVNYCLNENIEFSLINSNSEEFLWYYDQNGLNPIDQAYLFNNGASLVLPATSTGNNTLYYQAINESGCLSLLQSISFSVAPAPTNINITNNQAAYCIGDEIEIIAGANNANEFEWFLDQNATTLVDNSFLYGPLKERYKPTISQTGTHTVWVRAKNAEGCATELVQVSFQIIEIPEINTFATLNGASLYVAGEQIVFNIEGENYDRYKILKNGSNFLPQNNNFIPGSITQYVLTENASTFHQGNYTLILSNGTCFIEQELTIIVIPHSVVITHNKTSNIELDNGEQKVILTRHQDITFTSNISNLNDFSFEWHFGDGFTNSIGDHYYNNSGQYDVSLYVHHNVLEEGFTVMYQHPVMVKNGEQTIDLDPFNPPTSGITIFPNPVVNQININTNNVWDPYTSTVRIYNLEGITVYAESYLVILGQNTHTIENPLIGRPTGVYFLRIFKSENEYETFRIVKQ